MDPLPDNKLSANPHSPCSQIVGQVRGLCLMPAKFRPPHLFRSTAAESESVAANGKGVTQNTPPHLQGEVFLKYEKNPLLG